MKLRSPLLALLVTGLSFGCGGGAKPAETAEVDESKPSPEAWEGMMKTYSQQLELCEKATTDTEAKLTIFLDKVQGKANDAMGKPLAPMSEVAAKLAQEKVVVTLENRATPEYPMFFVKDSFMDEGAKLAGQPPAKMQAYAKRSMVINPLTSALRDQVAAANTALGTSLTNSGSCTQYAKAFGTQLGAIKNGGHEPTPEVFDLYAKYLKANLRNQNAASTTIGSIAILQLAIKGSGGKPGDSKSIDAVANAARETIATPVNVTPEQAKKAYEVAAAELTGGCEKALEDYAKKHPEAKVDPKGSCSGEGLKSKRPKPAKGEDEGGGLFDTILSIVPGGSMAKAAITGVKALADGDPATALRAAAAMVPPGTPLGMALQTAMPLALGEK